MTKVQILLDIYSNSNTKAKQKLKEGILFNPTHTLQKRKNIENMKNYFPKKKKKNWKIKKKLKKRQ